jgi:hypothetical protein
MQEASSPPTAMERAVAALYDGNGLILIYEQASSHIF